jgi:hypothetical protein
MRSGGGRISAKGMLRIAVRGARGVDAVRGKLLLTVDRSACCLCSWGSGWGGGSQLGAGGALPS